MTSPKPLSSKAILPAAIAVICALTPTSVQADRLIVNGQEYAGAEIIDMQGGRLRFRLAGGRVEEAWADDVDRIHIDHGGAFMDFNQAERLAAQGKLAAAIPRYARSLRLVEDFWPDLISMRLVKTCDANGNFDDAVEHFIRVLLSERSGPPAASRILPLSVPKKRRAKVTRALARINAKLGRGSDATDAQKALLGLLHFEILRQTGDDKTMTAARTVAETSIPKAARSTQAYAIVLRALNTLLAGSVPTPALEGMNTAIRDCPKESLAKFLLLRGTTMLKAAVTRKDVIRATWTLMRVAIHLPNDVLAPDALYESAVALERLGRQDQAATLLRECQQHAKVSAKTGALAKVAMKRLHSTGTD